jgi:hypothetical protein
MGPPAAHYAPSEPGVAGVATNACVALTATIPRAAAAPVMVGS